MSRAKKAIDQLVAEDQGKTTPAGQVGKREAWDIGLSAEHVSLRERDHGIEVWAQDEDEPEATFRGVLACDVEAFWEECTEGLSK